MPEQELEKGVKFLGEKWPEVTETAVKRFVAAGWADGALAKQWVSLKKKKNKTSEDKKKLDKIEFLLVSKWLQKIDNQFRFNNIRTYGNDAFDSSDVFQRWANNIFAKSNKRSVYTRELTSKEFKRINEERVLDGGSIASKEKILDYLRTRQQRNLNEWLHYFTTAEGQQAYSTWFRFYVMHNVVTRDKDGKTRRPDTTKDFLDLHQGALARVYDEMLEFLHAGDIEALKQYKFHQRYNAILADIEKEAQELQDYDGWVEFTDANRLAGASAGTPWCLSGYSVASDYLKRGPVHVYFKTGKAQVGIHVVDGEIREVRGSDDSQEMPRNKEVARAVEEKLKEFSNAGKWQKQVEHSKRLTEVLTKLEAKKDLSIEDLRFIYEVDEPFQSLGYTNVLSNVSNFNAIWKDRDLQGDVAKILGVKRSEVARDPRDITKKTKVYFGHFSSRLFADLHSGIEYIYIKSFQNRVRVTDLGPPFSGDGTYAVLDELHAANIDVGGDEDHYSIDDGQLSRKSSKGKRKIIQMDTEILRSSFTGLYADEIEHLARQEGLRFPTEDEVFRYRRDYTDQPESEHVHAITGNNVRIDSVHYEIMNEDGTLSINANEYYANRRLPPNVTLLFVYENA